jgi:SAM-dependent methyltransferase
VGLRPTIDLAPRELRRRAARLVFERGELEDTYGHIELEEFGLDSAGRVPYEPSPWSHLPRALRGRRITRRDAFIDYGCGKGRVVYQAARLPFGRVIGMDISPDLIGVAQRNISRNHMQLRCTDVSLICADVDGFDPPDYVNYAYFFNPFAGALLRTAIEGLLRSLDRNPREITVIYANPCEPEAFESTGRMTLEHLRGRFARDRQIHVYRAR